MGRGGSKKLGFEEQEFFKRLRENPSFGKKKIKKICIVSRIKLNMLLMFVDI
jgi:hypothetical protein